MIATPVSRRKRRPAHLNELNPVGTDRARWRVPLLALLGLALLGLLLWALLHGRGDNKKVAAVVPSPTATATDASPSANSVPSETPSDGVSAEPSAGVSSGPSSAPTGTAGAAASGGGTLLAAGQSVLASAAGGPPSWLITPASCDREGCAGPVGACRRRFLGRHVGHRPGLGAVDRSGR